jgi:hypothetical protein
MLKIHLCVIYLNDQSINQTNKQTKRKSTNESNKPTEANPFWERNIIRDVPKDEMPNRIICMGNHVSFSDGWFTTGLIPIAPKVAAQAPVFDYPFIGEILGESGNIPVEFEQRANGKWGTAKGAGDRILARAKEYLDNDCPVAVMPEGAIRYVKLNVVTHFLMLRCIYICIHISLHTYIIMKYSSPCI